MRLSRAYTNNDDDRQDLYQEMLIQIWKSLPRFKRDSSIGTWLYRIALNVSVSHVRKEKTRQKYYDEYEKEEKDKREGMKNPETIKTEHEEISQLYEAINSLNLSEKAIITLYLEEFSYADIASIVGITESYVGVKLHRIKQTMSEYIKDHYGVR